MTVWILSTCAIVAALMLLRLILKGRMDPRLTYALWLLAALRILIPGSLFQSPASVEALAERTGVTERIDQARYAPERATMYAPGTYDPADEELMLRSFTQTATAQGAWGGRDIAGMRVVDVHEPAGAASSSQVEVEIVRDRSFPLRLAWYAGAALVGVWFLAVNLRFSHRLRRERVPFQGELPVPCGLKVYIVEDLPSPCLAGLFRPAVYLNQAAVENERLDHILTHELTHCRHGDQWWALLRCVCIAVQWFDPLVWVAAYLSRQDCESACDASAIKALGEGERIGYGRTLVNMIAAGRAPSAVFNTATTMTGGEKSIYRRISLIAKKPKMTALTLTAVILTVAVTAGCTFGGAGESGGVEDPTPEGTGAVQPSESVPPQPSSTDLAAHYYDLFRADSGIYPLVKLATADGSISDEQICAYCALRTLDYGFSHPYSTGAVDSISSRHFDRTVPNFALVSYEGEVGLVLDGEPEERDGAIAARFKCYELSDGLWFSDEMDQEKLENAREYLLSGDDEGFPAPRPVEIVFEERYDEETQSPYVFYRSLTVLQ